MTLPTFVTRVKVGKGRDKVLISAESPAGDMARGQVESVETFRIVVSLSTFAEMTELFVRTLNGTSAAPAQPSPAQSEAMAAANDAGARRKRAAKS
jgi:hypothetical protein